MTRQKKTLLWSTVLLVSLNMSCEKTEPTATTDATDSTASAGSSTGGTSSSGTSSTTTTAGVSAGDGVNVGMSGTLMLNSAALVEASDSPDSVMAVSLADGSFNFGDEVIKGTIDKSGKFDIDLPLGDPTLVKLESTVKSDGTIDQEKLAVACKECVGHPDSEIKEHIDSLKEKKRVLTWIVIAYKASATGDRAAEAKTFKFIGLKSGKSSLIGLPISKAKGNLGLGEVTIDGDNAVGSLEADPAAFDLPPAALAGMAATSDMFKNLANAYINTDPSDGSTFGITPFFMFKWDIADMVDQFLDPAKTTLQSYSTYIAPRGKPYKLSEACEADETKRLSIKVIPPAELKSSSGQTFGPDAPLANTGTSAGVTDEGGRVGRKTCKDAAYYMAGNQDQDDGLEQIGLGGQWLFSNGIIDGFWKLSIGGDVVAQYNLNVGKPADKDGFARIFVPL